MTSPMCYYPNGAQASGDTACHSGTYSTCCGSGYICLSNNICMADGAEIQKPDASTYVRGSCTDQSWESPECPRFCINSTLDDVGGGEGIAKCPNTSLDLYYCIDGNYQEANCTSGNLILSFAGTPSVLTTIGITPISTTATSTSTSPTHSTSALAVTTSQSQSPTTTTTPSPTTNPYLGGAQTSPAAAATTTAVAHHNVAGAAAGGAVGGAAVVLLVGGIAWYIQYRRKQRRITGLEMDVHVPMGKS